MLNKICLQNLLPGDIISCDIAAFNGETNNLERWYLVDMCSADASMRLVRQHSRMLTVLGTYYAGSYISYIHTLEAGNVACWVTAAKKVSLLASSHLRR